MSKKTQFQMTISAEDKASSAFQKVSRSSKSLGTDLGALDKLFTNLGGGFDASTITAALGGIAGGVSLAASLQEFAAFQKALWETTKVTDESTASIRKKMIEIPAELGSATELTTGYYQVISAGITDVADAMDMLNVASQTAKSAGVTQAEAINALAKVMNAYGEEVENASVAANMFFGIEKLGMTNVRELAPLMGDLSGVAKSLGVEYYDLAGSMALITQTSGSASESATRLRSLLSELGKPAKNLQMAFDAVGIKSAKSLIEVEGFAGALRKIEEGARKSGQTIAEAFGSQEAYQGFIKLQKDSFNFVENYSQEIKTTTDALSNAFDGYTKILDGKFVTTQSHLSNLSIRAGESFGGIASSSLDTFNSSLGYLTQNFETAKDSTIIFGAALTSLIAAKKLAGIELGSLGAQYTKFGGVAIQTASTMTRMATLARGVGTSLLSAFGGPVGLAVTALGGGMAYLATRESEAEKAARLLAQAQEEVKKSLDASKKAAKEHSDELSEAAKLYRELAQQKFADAAIAQWKSINEAMNATIFQHQDWLQIGKEDIAQNKEKSAEMDIYAGTVKALTEQLKSGAITGAEYENAIALFRQQLKDGTQNAKDFGLSLDTMFSAGFFSRIAQAYTEFWKLRSAANAASTDFVGPPKPLQESSTSSPALSPAIGSGASKASSEAKKKAEETKRAIEDLNNEIAKLTMTDAAYREFELTNKLEDLQEKLPNNIALIQEFEAAQRAAWGKEDDEEAKKKNKENLDVQAAFYNELIDKSGQYSGMLDLQTQAIARQIETWREAGIPETYLQQMEYLSTLEIRTDFFAGLERGFLSAGKDAFNFASYSESVVTSAFGHMNDALDHFAKTGKLNFSDLANSILADMAKMAAQAATSSLFNGIGSIFGSIFGSGASSGGIAGAASSIFSKVMHTGGIVGASGGATRAVPHYLFSDAPRFHDGGIIGADEVPIIAQREEGIFTKQQMRYLAPTNQKPVVNVRVYNETNVPNTAIESSQSVNADGDVEVTNRIISTVTKDILQGGSIKRAIDAPKFQRIGRN